MTDKDKTMQSDYDIKEAFYGAKVDIIIPFHKQESKVTKLVRSILTHTYRTNSYRIILVDDYSKNDWGALWEHVPGVSIVRNEKQLGFGGSLYQGFINSDAPWVVFMHSDCVVETPKWLFEMGRSLVRFRDEKSKVKMVSAKSDNPGDQYDVRLKSDKNEISDDVVANTALPLYCAMCHRELFERIGGFIKKYPYAFYEDEELAHRMKKYGYEQAICGKSWVKHEGGATINAIVKNNMKIKNTIEGNRELCMKDMGLIK